MTRPVTSPADEIDDRTRLDLLEDQLGDGLGAAIPLPEEWSPGDECPKTREPCHEALKCWQDSACSLRATTTSKIAAEAGAILARWAREAGAEGMCAGCAFRLGTRANRTDDTIIQIVDAARSGVPFYCHAGLSYGEAATEICRGWAALQDREESP